jgi:PAS domain S-box-containing protein
MSDSDAAGQVQVPATTSSAPGGPSLPSPEPTALLILDRTTGRVAAGNPAGRRRLAGLPGSRLSYQLADLATAPGHRDGAAVRIWADEDAADDVAVRRRVRVLSVPIGFRSRDCLLVVLLDDVSAPMPLPAGAGEETPGTEHGCAVFTLDAVGRIDSWGLTPQQLIGHRPECIISADASLLHPAPARLAGDPHRALNQAYRTGEHRTEGWRVCSDGGLIWAEVTTTPLYDGVELLLGFAQVIFDLTPVRRLQLGRGDHPGASPGATPAQRTARQPAFPAPRPPAAPPAGAPVRAPRRPAGRIPAQRRP